MPNLSRTCAACGKVFKMPRRTADTLLRSTKVNQRSSRLTRKTMHNEYDFSNGERGKFHRDTTLELPIYLAPPIREYLVARAKAKGIGINQLVNELLKRSIELIEAVK